MKNKLSKYFAVLLAATTLAGAVSCQDYLTVNPDNDGTDYVLFSNTDGFVEALTGIYTVARRGSYNPVDGAFFSGYTSLDYNDLMLYLTTTPSDYEHDFSALIRQEKGLFEYMSCFWPCANTSLNYKEEQLYLHRYDDPVITNNILVFFRNQYEIVTNTNLILKWVDAREQNFLSDRDYHIIKGEALAMRAFALFDLIRAFGPPPTMSGLHGELYIPYPHDLRTTSYPRETYTRFMELLVEDLDNASALLKDHDPITTTRMSQLKRYPSAHLPDAWLYNRHTRMNYYAVQGLRARVHQWRGSDNDRSLAFTFAAEVVAAQVLGEKTFTFNNAEDYNWQTMIIPKNEMIFGMPAQTAITPYRYVKANGPAANIKYFAIGSAQMSFVDEHLNSVFGGPEAVSSVKLSDVRYSRQLHLTTGNMGMQAYHPVKFAPFSDTGNQNLTPMIRLSEMYLIAADCAPTDGESLKYLNILREAKASAAIYEGDRDKWILCEYGAEFWGEGQLWFCYKRLGLDTIPFAYYRTAPVNYFQGFAGPVPMDADAYMLPVPWEEITSTN